MAEVYLVSAAMTPFGRFPESSPQDLAGELIRDLLTDMDLEDGQGVESVFFGSAAHSLWGQLAIPGQVVLSPLIQSDVLPRYVSITNVEGGCATGSMAFHGAYKDIQSGQVDLSLALGLDKTFYPGKEKALGALLAAALDQIQPSSWKELYASESKRYGLHYETDASENLLSLYSLKAQYYQQQHGLDLEDLAFLTEKNRLQGSRNPKASFQRPLSAAELSAEKPIFPLLTKSGCASLGDGAAGVVLCSKKGLELLPEKTQGRAIRVLSSVLSSGFPRSLAEPSALQFASAKAYWEAELGPEKIDLAEVHDATAISELLAYEDLGFCEAGEGRAYLRSGATRYGGSRPVNVSGGLLSKGHPLGATGLAMIYELALQLRGEAGERQVENVEVALAQNAGGLLGFDEAVQGLTVLGRA
ncbi:MAG: thiolase family protein [Planctomycetota bacterium]|nr:thiolase family protein [Planctomycetota bacterium]